MITLVQPALPQSWPSSSTSCQWDKPQDQNTTQWWLASRLGLVRFQIAPHAEVRLLELGLQSGTKISQPHWSRFYIGRETMNERVTRIHRDTDSTEFVVHTNSLLGWYLGSRLRFDWRGSKLHTEDVCQTRIWGLDEWAVNGLNESWLIWIGHLSLSQTRVCHVRALHCANPVRVPAWAAAPGSPWVCHLESWCTSSRGAVSPCGGPRSWSPHSHTCCNKNRKHWSSATQIVWTRVLQVYRCLQNGVKTVTALSTSKSKQRSVRGTFVATCLREVHLNTA